MRIVRRYDSNFNNVFRSYTQDSSTPINTENLIFVDSTISSNTSLTETNGLITKLINAAGSNVTITLPTAANNTASFIIKKIDSSTNTVIVDGYSSETIDGDTSITIYDQYNYIEIISDGTNWKVINEYLNLKW